MSLRFLRPLTVGAILWLVLMMTAFPTSAAAHGQSVVKLRLPLATAQHTTTRIIPDAALVIGDNKHTHYLFAEDGTSPDSIDVFKIGMTLTHVGNYPTNANNSSQTYIGTQKIALSKMDKAHGNCLILIDTNNVSPPGFVDSFSINADGSLSAEVSHLQVAGGRDPSDVHVIGATAYVVSPGNDFESYAVGAGCTLTFLSKIAAPQNHINFALVGSTELVAPDFASGNIDVYTLGTGGTITFLMSTKGQVSSPDGVAVQVANTKSGVVTNVFTGSFSSPAMAQGGQLNKTSGMISFLKGSPASDPSGSYGVAETFDHTDHLLIQGEFISGTLGVYSVTAGKPGTAGSIAFLQDVPLVNSDHPQDFAQFGTTLFLNGLYNGDIEACTLSPSGVSGCASAARLTSTTDLASGLVIL